MTRFAWPALALVPALFTACAPDDIARSSCHSGSILSTADPWSCTIHAQRVGRASSLEFDTESRNQVAQVKLLLKVEKGTLRVSYWDLEGNKQLVVTPGAPASLEMRTRLHRERRSFTLSFQPLGGDVEGLTGTLDYSTPVLKDDR